MIYRFTGSGSMGKFEIQLHAPSGQHGPRLPRCYARPSNADTSREITLMESAFAK
jgi:hypothetical protein